MLVEYVCGGKVTGEVQLTGEEGGGGDYEIVYINFQNVHAHAYSVMTS